ncbi:TonB-dependent receptor [Xylophilus sp.]|uniref:TonB-dependent receptor n=1 Tax=Xylophilus sp. TaxID=2653893 RepID=UPI0013B7B0EC|nr:TonB-dependent receptor [Xylophilus sp.]KAF1046982.1 MAG: Pesticin receptor [Xylophilus sp.]
MTTAGFNDGRRVDSIDRDGIRGQLLWQPHGRFSLRLTGDYNSAVDTQGSGVITGLGPVQAGSRTLAQANAIAGGLPLSADWQRYESGINDPQTSAVRQSGLSAEADWTLPGGYRLTSISAVRTWHSHPHNDPDLTSVSAVADLYNNSDARQASQELRLASPTGGAFDYVVGGYWFWQDSQNHYTTVGGPYADLFLLPTSVPLGYNFLGDITSNSLGRVRTNSCALFGQGNWHIDERWDVTAGLRGTYEEKHARVTRDDPIGGTALPVFTGPYASLNTIRPGQYAAWDSGALGLSNFGPSALVGTSYKLRPGMLAYVSLSHGEKSGGFNANGVGSGPALGVDSLRVGPERANNLELGFKSTLWDRRLLFNANAYTTRVTGYQAVGMVTPAGSLVPVQTLSNVGSVESKGFEWQLQAQPARGWLLNLNGAFNDARYRSFANAPVPAEAYANGAAPTVQDLSGQRVYGAPRWTFNIGGSYRWGWSPQLSQTVAANYAWRSESFGYLDNSIYSRIPAYGLLNLSTGWQFTVQGTNLVELSLWARNALDRRYLLAVQPTIQGAYLGSVGAPRTVGATLRYSFV